MMWNGVLLWPAYGMNQVQVHLCVYLWFKISVIVSGYILFNNRLNDWKQFERKKLWGCHSSEL